MKKILIVFNLLCLFGHGFPQSQEYINHSKYWFLRNRLINEFVKVGFGPGGSLVAERVDNSSEYGSISDAEGVGEDAIFHPERRQIHYGDQAVHLGWYIAVLATEYELLSRNGQDVNQTLSELIFAVQAVDRLDRDAELFRYCNQDDGSEKIYPYDEGEIDPDACYEPQTNANGFFVRSDVPASEVDPSFQNYFINKFMTEDGTSAIEEIWGNPKNPTGWEQQWFTGIEQSHDQIALGLMLGSALVKKYLDGMGAETYSSQVMDRIMSYMSNGYPKTDNVDAFFKKYMTATGYFLGWPVIAYYDDNNDRFFPWLIVNPITGVPVQRGAFPRLHSYGYAMAGEYITENSYDEYANDGFNVVPRQWRSAWNDVSWNNSRFDDLGDHMKFLHAAAIGDSWDDCLLRAPEPIAPTDALCFLFSAITGWGLDEINCDFF